MNEVDKIRNIAEKYFRGDVSSKEESFLYAFIAGEDEHKMMFRQWEKEWNESRANDELQDMDLCKLHKKIQVHSINLEFGKYKKKHRAIVTCAMIAIAVLVSLSVHNNFLARQHNAEFLSLNSPKGERCNAVLYDGTNVMLNSETSLWIGGSFNRQDRTVRLKGEAYFEVAKNEQKKFVVESESCNIVVKGTKFNVMAYPDENCVTTSVVEGNVEVQFNGESYDLVRGQVLEINTGTKRCSLSEYDLEESIAWVNNRLSYDNIRFADFIRIISRTYGVSFVFGTHSYDNEAISISLRNNESIYDVLNAIKTILPVKIKTEEDIIYIN